MRICILGADVTVTASGLVHTRRVAVLSCTSALKAEENREHQDNMKKKMRELALARKKTEGSAAFRESKRCN